MSTQGERLRQAIELAGFSKVAHFAESVGEPPITVRQHINRERIPMRVVEKYVRALRKVGVTTDWLLHAKGVPPKGAGQGNDEDRATPEIPVRSYVGAGDEIISLQDDEEPLYWTPAPPGLEDAEATQVRGASMAPLYHDGDILFHRRHAVDPLTLRGEVVVLQTRNRKRMVKMILPGSKKGLFHLVSFNSLNPPIEDQQLAWVAPILWVKKRQRL